MMKQLGGIHRLMGWDKPILTDSGGFQVFSLSKINKTTEEGVEFRSHIDGAKVYLNPEISMRMQGVLGSDIVMQFDDVADGTSTKERFEEAMERSLRWAMRCKEAFAQNAKHQKLFGIVQGGIHEDLRLRSAKGLMEIGFNGYAIGGLSVGEPRPDMYNMVETCCGVLPKDKPRYFMGGGMPEEIVRNVFAGVDMFDCVLPTRNARHGTLFIWTRNPDEEDWGKVPENFYARYHATNEQFKLSEDRIDPYCDCETCNTTSRAYLRHLFSISEPLAQRLATIHNLRFYLKLMESLRGWIEK
jgi:queuine tRNA-ribosyltransferase